MKTITKLTTICTLSLALASVSIKAADLEVTHWWTSGGEAAAASVLAKHFNNNTEHNWVDGAVAGGGGTALPVIISRILGGEPMGATQMNHGRQAEELIEAGLLTDLTELAEAQNWREIVHPVSLLDSCTVDGRVYCVPVNIHSAQWIWLSHGAYKKAGVKVPTDWYEFVKTAPALEKAGLIPLAEGQQGWQHAITMGTLTLAVAGLDAWREVNINKNAKVAAGPDYKRAFEAIAQARELAKKSTVQDWNLATNLVITDKAGGQIMGDWAQGEFQVAGEVAGKDYSCLPGLGLNEVLDTGGDAFYFPVIDDPEVKKAQLALASMLISPPVQVEFNLAKGSLPVRGDIDMSAANQCMQKGLDILAAGGILPSNRQSFTADTDQQINDLMSEFWGGSMSPKDAQARFAKIIANAD